MKKLSQVVEINGGVYKVEDGKIYARYFGTTIYNQSMHYSWGEIPLSVLKPEVAKQLKELL